MKYHPNPQDLPSRVFLLAIAERVTNGLPFDYTPCYIGRDLAQHQRSVAVPFFGIFFNDGNDVG